MIWYVDYDYPYDLDKWQSTTEYVFIFIGEPVSWKSMLQSIVTLSTIEAEYNPNQINFPIQSLAMTPIIYCVNFNILASARVYYEIN